MPIHIYRYDSIVNMCTQACLCMFFIYLKLPYSEINWWNSPAIFGYYTVAISDSFLVFKGAGSLVGMLFDFFLLCCAVRCDQKEKKKKNKHNNQHHQQPIMPGSWKRGREKRGCISQLAVYFQGKLHSFGAEKIPKRLLPLQTVQFRLVDFVTLCYILCSHMPKIHHA